MTFWAFTSQTVVLQGESKSLNFTRICDCLYNIGSCQIAAQLNLEGIPRQPELEEFLVSADFTLTLIFNISPPPFIVCSLLPAGCPLVPLNVSHHSMKQLPGVITGQLTANKAARNSL